MKKKTACFMALVLFLMPAVLFAQNASGVVSPKDEIKMLNSMPGSAALLQQSGGNCWKTCDDGSGFSQRCWQTCDDSGSSSGGGGASSFLDFENDPGLAWMQVGLILVTLGLCAFAFSPLFH
jgi:hypothetical protein